MRGRRWVVGALAGYGLAVVLVLVLPIGYADIVAFLSAGLDGVLGGAYFGSGWVEFGANVLMFVPLGLLLTLLFLRPWLGFACALAISVAAEVSQILIPSRQASLRDVIANALGAACGAAIAWIVVCVRRRRDRRRAHSAG